MRFPGSSTEGAEMRQVSIHPASTSEGIASVQEGSSSIPSSSTSPTSSPQHEALRRVKTASKPVRSSPLAGPALSGIRPSVPAKDARTITSKASSSSLLLRPRSILLAEPLSNSLRSKPSQSDMKRPTLKISTSSSSRSPSSSETRVVRLSPLRSASSLDDSQISARYRPSASDVGNEDAPFDTNLHSSGHTQHKRLSASRRHISIARPPSVIISPTETIFRPQSEIIYTPSRSLTAPPQTQPRSRVRRGERTALDGRSHCESTSTSCSTSPSSPIPEKSPSASPIQLPSPIQPKSILKHASSSMSRHSPGMSSSLDASTAVAPAKPALKDNSWYVNSPYAITPRFTRLGLNAPGVVLPLSVKEYKRCTANAASLGRAKASLSELGKGANNAVGLANASRSGTAIGAAASESRPKISRRASSPSTFPLLASVARDNHIEAGSHDRARSSDHEASMSAEPPLDVKSNDSPSPTFTETRALEEAEAQPQCPSLAPYSQSPSPSQVQQSQSQSLSQSTSVDDDDNRGWKRTHSQSSAASSVSSLPLTLPSSLPDSTTLASSSSQTPSVRSAPSSVCTSVTSDAIDEKSEETALPHGDQVEARDDMDVKARVDVPTLALKKRRSVLERVKSLCWTGAAPEDDKPGRVEHGSTNIVSLPLPVVAVAAPSARPPNSRHSLPIMAVSSNGDAWVVPDLKTVASRGSFNLMNHREVTPQVAAPHVPVAAAALPTIREAEYLCLPNRMNGGGKEKLTDASVDVQYLDMGIVNSSLKKSQRNGTVRKVWESLRGGGRSYRGSQEIG
ncbi:hypothetical protein BDN70DRAFT_995161 [Pholiota conissans]|uniref:Uncharacterized protein n=1 Tax=Pholiota conissans TaxID=109636 RepID=A0A9P5Z0D3_9AGAR|nr:hypothetical protein BDN70DRAFT_995161 [Pholiota conissans]